MVTHRDLALLSARSRPFSSPEWLYELKFDGYRVLVIRDEGVSLISRQGRDMLTVAWRDAKKGSGISKRTTTTACIACRPRTSEQLVPASFPAELLLRRSLCKDKRPGVTGAVAWPSQTQHKVAREHHRALLRPVSHQWEPAATDCGEELRLTGRLERPVEP